MRPVSFSKRSPSWCNRVRFLAPPPPRFLAPFPLSRSPSRSPSFPPDRGFARCLGPGLQHTRVSGRVSNRTFVPQGRISRRSSVPGLAWCRSCGRCDFLSGLRPGDLQVPLTSPVSSPPLPPSHPRMCLAVPCRSPRRALCRLFARLAGASIPAVSRACICQWLAVNVTLPLCNPTKLAAP